jgi:hypothetical protein
MLGGSDGPVRNCWALPCAASAGVSAPAALVTGRVTGGGGGVGRVDSGCTIEADSGAGLGLSKLALSAPVWA